jgi:AcrR family transcriptional regulator
MAADATRAARAGDRAATERAPLQPVKAGRRRGNPDTRSTIVAAAQSEFADKGFDRTSMRGIAKSAGVDPALIYHYFASKDDVLLAAMDVPFDPRQVIPKLTVGGAAGLGDRIAAMFVSIWDDEANQVRLVAIVRAALGSPAAQDLLANGVARMVLRPISEAIGTPDAPVRAQLVISQLLGLALVRYVLRVEPLASAPADIVVASIGPTLQRYLDGSP